MSKLESGVERVLEFLRDAKRHVPPPKHYPIRDLILSIEDQLKEGYPVVLYPWEQFDMDVYSVRGKRANWRLDIETAPLSQAEIV